MIGFHKSSLFLQKKWKRLFENILNLVGAVNLIGGDGAQSKSNLHDANLFYHFENSKSIACQLVRTS